MLNLTDNVLLNEESKLFNIKTLFLNNKKLKHIPSIFNYDKIEILCLNDNEISTLSFCQNMTNLKELYMKNNNIKDLKELEYLSICKKLHTIFLKGNPIQLNNNLLYVKKIKSVVPSIKNIDGLKIIQNKKLNIYFQLNDPNKNRNKYSKFMNKDIFCKNAKINKNIINTENNEIESNKKNQIYKDFKYIEIKKKEMPKSPHFILRKYNSGKKVWNNVNFNNTINNDNKKIGKKRKKSSDFVFLKKMIDKSNENSYSNNINTNSNEENNNEVKNQNVFNSVNLLLNGLNLLQLTQLQNYVNKKLSTKMNIYNS